jgi:hypothetical protein
MRTFTVATGALLLYQLSVTLPDDLIWIGALLLIGMALAVIQDVCEIGESWGWW